MLPDLPEPILRALLDGPITEDDHRGEHGFELLDVLYLTAGDVCPLWVEHKEALLQAWISDHPGTRPQMWWHHDAPRQPAGRWPDCYWDGKLEEPRLRLGGVGTAAVEAAPHNCPSYHLGLPVDWITTEDLDEWRAAGIAAVPIDPADPPTFEAQASYLKRHGLFMRGEERRLPAHAFEPDAVETP